MTSSRTLIERIKHEFPSLHVSSAQRILSGYDNVVLDVNNRLIFRFPRSKYAEMNRQREIRLLPILAEYLSVQIPIHTFASQSRRRRYGFVGYKKIRGIPVTVSNYRSSWTPKLSQGLAKFLRELHSIKTAGHLARIVSREWTTERIRKYHNQLRSPVHKCLDHETRKLLESCFETGIKFLEQSNYRRVLIHSDLTDRNILVRPNDGRLAGILDWGDARISDPALDFCGLFEVNRRLGFDTVRLYDDGAPNFLERVEAYWRISPYLEILHSTHSGHNQIRDSEMKRIRTRLDAPGLVEEHTTSRLSLFGNRGPLSFSVKDFNRPKESGSACVGR